MAPRSVTRETLGAWVIKTDPATTSVDELRRTAFRTVTSRCVAPTYRTDLVDAGQPVLLWISGADRSNPAGIYAQGRTTGRVEATGADQLSMPMELEPVNPPVPRAEILAHPVVAQIEVVRMAAGSNPSYITRQHLEELVSRWPQVTVV